MRWLEEKRGVTKDLKVVDWKPEREDSWGLPSRYPALCAVDLPECPKIDRARDQRGQSARLVLTASFPFGNLRKTKEIQYFSGGRP